MSINANALSGDVALVAGANPTADSRFAA